MEKRVEFGWVRASIEKVGKRLGKSRTLARGKRLTTLRLATSLLIGTAVNAQAEMRCAALSGDYCISPEGAANLLFFQFDLWGLPHTQSPTEEDGPFGNVGNCGRQTLTTVQSAGPFSALDEGYLYEVTYYDQVYTIPSYNHGKCGIQISKWTFRGVDANGSNEHTNCNGAGTICAVRIAGAHVVVDPQKVYVDKTIALPIKVMTAAIPIRYQPVKVELVPASVNGRLNCPEVTDAAGLLNCQYTAPQACR